MRFVGFSSACSSSSGCVFLFRSSASDSTRLRDELTSLVSDRCLPKLSPGFNSVSRTTASDYPKFISLIFPSIKDELLCVSRTRNCSVVFLIFPHGVGKPTDTVSSSFPFRVIRENGLRRSLQRRRSFRVTSLSVRLGVSGSLLSM